eukprot:7710019-Alexandrium_andersonii.AAC.1
MARRSWAGSCFGRAQASPGAELMAIWRARQVPMWTAVELIHWCGLLGWADVEVVAQPQGPHVGWAARGRPRSPGSTR